MGIKTLKQVNNTNINTVPQTQQAHPEQVLNAAGGYVFKVEDIERLRRFLVLGTEGGTFYVSESGLTLDNAQVVLRLAQTNHEALVDTIVEVSDQGAAYRPDPSLFALAIASSYGDTEEKRYALSKLPEVARTGTHLFTFVGYVQQFRGWGAQLRKGIAAWYLNGDVNRLAYQAVKYRSREGWTHRDVLRKSHPTTEESTRRALFNWIVTRDASDPVLPPLVPAFEALQKATSVEEVINLMEQEPSLSWEMLPNELLNNKKVWEVLILKGMPMTALIRQLPRITRMGLLEKKAVRSKILEQLADEEYLQKSRIHPMQVLVAMNTYAEGRSYRGSSTWEPDAGIVIALDEAFYKTFKNVTPTGKRILVAIDVSGSMGWDDIAPGITPAKASAAMAMIYKSVEENVDLVAFSTSGGGRYRNTNNEIVPVNLSKSGTLGQAMSKIESIPMGGTDCALPWLWAYDNKKKYDAVIVLTDNETWAGYEHPYRAAETYRKRFGLDTKFVVFGMTATESSITNPDDPLSLSVVGFDPSAVSVVSSFIGEV